MDDFSFIKHDEVIEPDDDYVDTFETILGLVLGGTWILEELESRYNFHMREITLTEEEYEQDEQGYMLAHIQSLNINSHLPIPIIVRYEKEGWEDWVHYVIYINNIIWDPFVMVGYPNCDSWCQTCVTAQMLFLLEGRAVPWNLSDWADLGLIDKHIQCRRVACELVTLGIEKYDLDQDVSKSIIEAQAEEGESPQVGYFSAGGVPGGVPDLGLFFAQLSQLLI